MTARTGGTPGTPGTDETSEDDDWAWRRRIRANPRTRAIYRMFVGVVGTLVTLLGLFLIPAPGPGWVVVFAGLAILASEFVWAARLLNFAKKEVRRWTDWAARQSLVVRMLLALATLALVVAVFWVLFRVSGVPGFVPDSWVPGWTGLRTG